jgi:ribosomal protein S18 acetylase RimI-like enzyme
MSFKIREKNDKDIKIVTERLIEEYGFKTMITPAKEYQDLSILDGFLAFEENKLIGQILLNYDNNDCEIVELHTKKQGVGIGTELIKKSVEKAKNKGCRRIWVSTSNDNIDALKFYQKRMFFMCKIHKNHLDKVRAKHPHIPEYGDYGILLKDQIELEMVFQ